jgi:dCMP deaminase
MGVARAVSTRGECTRRQVGAVILDAQRRICGAGYNGAAPGAPSCLDGACPRGQHYEVSYGPNDPGCACGDPWPCPDAVAPGSSYDTGPGACIAVHAELNALLDVSDRSRLDGAILFVTAVPCEGCLKILKNTRIELVAYEDENGANGVKSLR